MRHALKSSTARSCFERNASRFLLTACKIRSQSFFVIVTITGEVSRGGSIVVRDTA